VELVLDFDFVDGLLEFGDLEVEFLSVLGHFLHLDLEAFFQLLDQNFVSLSSDFSFVNWALLPSSFFISVWKLLYWSY